MAQTRFDFLDVFVRSPGDLLYFILILAIGLISLFIALGERWRQPHNRTAMRYTIASAALVGAWMLLVLGALVAIVSDQSVITILPPLERAIHVIAIALIGWAFLTADHSRWERASNIVLIVLLLLTVGGYIITGSEWNGIARQVDFNLTSYAVTWAFIPAVLSFLGMVLIVINFRLITDAPLKLVYFIILLLGNAATLFQISQGSTIGQDAGLARLAFAIAMPIFPAVIYRMIVGQLQTELVSFSQAMPAVATSASSTPPPLIDASTRLPQTPAPSVSPMQRDSIQLLKTLGLIMEDATPEGIPERIVKATLDMMKGEIGAILHQTDPHYVDIMAAYNNRARANIPGLSLNLQNQATLSNAIERRLQRTLTIERNEAELRDLYSRLDIESVGICYFQPLISGKELIAILLIAMPYSNRELQENERELLKGIGIIAGNLLSLSFAALDARFKAEEQAIQAMVDGVPPDQLPKDSLIAARLEMQAELQLFRDQNINLSKQIAQLKLELDRERARLANMLGNTESGLSVSQRIVALNDDHQRLLDERAQLLGKLQQAETVLAGATLDDQETSLKTMLEALRHENDLLTAQRNSLQAQISQTQADSISSDATEAQHLLEQMGQEKSRLISERDDLYSRLNALESQLAGLGIQNGISGLSQLISQLTEQRNTLQTRVDSFTLERTALLNERAQYESSIKQEKERTARLTTLQNEIRHLAADREAINRERDRFRAERDELLAMQETFKQQRARLLAEASGYQIELAENHQEQARLRAQLQEFNEIKVELESQRDRLFAERQSLTTQRDQLEASYQGNRERLQEINEGGVNSLTRMVDELTQQRSQLESELGELRNQYSQAQNQLEIWRVKAQSAPQGESRINYNPEVFLSMVQELRTPATSIMGYIDLLLDESAGILGEMQRKFLQRVASNINRLQIMLEDLTRVTALDADQGMLLALPVDIISIIEDSITASTYQFREKGLTVNLELDDNAPKIRADKDAITQIINQLLVNAYLASPPDSQVYVVAELAGVQRPGTRLNDETDCLLISVTDRGAGISANDLPHVFDRKYRADNPLIEGLGDTGVGLSIAKALAEAHSGDLWVETVQRKGSTFYFALPIASNTYPTINRGN